MTNFTSNFSHHSKGAAPSERVNPVLQIANAASFVAQKLLISELRPPRKRAQDILYIHDTLDLFGAELTSLNAIWINDLRRTLPKSAVSRVESAHRDKFSEVTDAIREAARMPLDRRLTAERVQLACAYGLQQLFAPPR